MDTRARQEYIAQHTTATTADNFTVRFDVRCPAPTERDIRAELARVSAVATKARVVLDWDGTKWAGVSLVLDRDTEAVR